MAVSDNKGWSCDPLTYASTAFLLSLFSIRMGSSASPNRLAALYGTEANLHLEHMSACQLRRQRRRREMTKDAKAREANFAVLNMASAENSVAAINLFISWCNLVSLGGSLTCSWQSQIKEALLKKDAADVSCRAPSQSFCPLPSTLQLCWPARWWMMLMLPLSIIMLLHSWQLKDPFKILIHTVQLPVIPVRGWNRSRLQPLTLDNV